MGDTPSVRFVLLPAKRHRRHDVTTGICVQKRKTCMKGTAALAEAYPVCSCGSCDGPTPIRPSSDGWASASTAAMLGSLRHRSHATACELGGMLELSRQARLRAILRLCVGAAGGQAQAVGCRLALTCS